jgi:hypothetical protein
MNKIYGLMKRSARQMTQTGYEPMSDTRIEENYGHDGYTRIKKKETGLTGWRNTCSQKMCKSRG